MSKPLPDVYARSSKNPSFQLSKSLSRLALFANSKRIRTPAECKAALDSIEANLFYEGQYNILLAYSRGLI